MAEVPSQYAEEMETFRRILNFPDPKKTMLRFSNSVLGLDDKKGQQGKYIKPPSFHCKVVQGVTALLWGQIQELNTDFWKICISPKPSRAPMGKVLLPILKGLEH